jgi:hypothetical protein
MSFLASAKQSVKYEDIAWFVRRFVPGDSLFFLDACFITGEEKPPQLWNALLDRRLRITPLVRLELEPWLSTPHRNHYLHDTLSRKIDDFVAVVPDEVCDVDYGKAAAYYVNLLSVRKRMGHEVYVDLERQLGRSPDKRELREAIQKIGADHDLRLMAKGADDLLKPNFFADEELVVTALITALLEAREVTIFSSLL